MPLAPRSRSISGRNGHDTPKPTLHKAVVIPWPTAAENVTGFFTDRAITITQVTCVLVGSGTPALRFRVHHAADRSAAGSLVLSDNSSDGLTCDTMTAYDSGTIDTANDNVAANSWVWIETDSTGAAATVNELSVYIEYTED